jgi:hypothetical protein
MVIIKVYMPGEPTNIAVEMICPKRFHEKIA